MDIGMNRLEVGVSRVDITPMMGIKVRGYLIPRFAEAVLDPLQINAIAFAAGESRAVLLSLDLCRIGASDAVRIRTFIAEQTGLPVDAIWLHCIHTHTGPEVTSESDDVLLQEYYQMLRRRCVDAASFALADLKPAKMGWAVGQAPNVAFIRRFRMKDGSVQTNPGVGNPNIDYPIGTVDERVNVLRFDREGDKSVVLVNFGNHPDTVGGCKISADWPGFLRRTFEKAIDNTFCVFCNGAQGDVNHVNVNAKDGDFNDMFMDFDDVSRGYGHTRHMGNVVAAAVMQVYDKVNYVDVENISFLKRDIEIPTSVPTAEEAARAHEIVALHEAGRDAELPYKGMMLTTVVAEARRMVRLEHGPDHFDMSIFGLCVGDFAMVGIPGEPFTGIGRGLKEAEGWKLVLPCCLTNGAEAYFPMKDAYDEGGYEARSSSFKAGVAEQIIEEGKMLLRDLRREIDTYR